MVFKDVCFTPLVFNGFLTIMVPTVVLSSSSQKTAIAGVLDGQLGRQAGHREIRKTGPVKRKATKAAPNRLDIPSIPLVKRPNRDELFKLPTKGLLHGRLFSTITVAGLRGLLWVHEGGCGCGQAGDGSDRISTVARPTYQCHAMSSGERPSESNDEGRKSPDRLRGSR